MKKHHHVRNILSAIVALAAITLASFLPISRARGLTADGLTAQDVVAKHLASMGSPEARNAIKSRVIMGTALATFRLGGKGQAEGRALLASQDTMNMITISFNVPDYPRENLGFDGHTLRVADLTPGVRSTLGKFFMTHEMPFRDGLIAGTLSSAWPLLDLSSRKVTLKYEGLKKVDGRQLHVLRYEAKNDSNLKTKLYFEADTFRHVRTEYEKRQIQEMVTEPGVTQKQGDSITKLTEEFADFKTEGDLTLPHSYKLQLSIEALNRRVLQDWAFTLVQFSFNKNLDKSQFDVTTR